MWGTDFGWQGARQDHHSVKKTLIRGGASRPLSGVSGGAGSVPSYADAGKHSFNGWEYPVLNAGMSRVSWVLPYEVPDDEPELVQRPAVILENPVNPLLVQGRVFMDDEVPESCQPCQFR